MVRERLLSIGITVEEDFPVDILRVGITIEGERDTKEECAEAYNEHLRRIRQGLVAAGIPEDDIKNNELAITPRTEKIYTRIESNSPAYGGYGLNDDRDYYVATEVLRGHRFDARVNVDCAAEPEMTKRVWLALAGCGDEVAYFLHFDIKDDVAAKKRLLTRAVFEGKERAEVLAAAAGARIVGIHAIEYEYEPSGVYGGDRMRGVALRAKSTYDDAPDFNPKDITVCCTVQMQWDMELV